MYNVMLKEDMTMSFSAENFLSHDRTVGLIGYVRSILTHWYKPLTVFFINTQKAERSNQYFRWKMRRVPKFTKTVIRVTVSYFCSSLMPAVSWNRVAVFLTSYKT